MIPGSLARIYQPRIRQKAIRSQCQGSRNNLAGSGNTVLLTYVRSLSLVTPAGSSTNCLLRRAPAGELSAVTLAGPQLHPHIPPPAPRVATPTALQRSQAYHNLLSSLRNLALHFPDHGYLRSNGPARRGGV
jgi:hypothetical protein